MPLRKRGVPFSGPHFFLFLFVRDTTSCRSYTRSSPRRAMIAPRPFWRSTPRIPGTFLPSPRRCVVVFVASTSPRRTSPFSFEFSPSSNGHEKRVSRVVVASSAHLSHLSNDQTSPKQQALEKVPQSDSAKFTYNADKHTFNYLVDSGFTYLVVADDACGRGTARTARGSSESRFLH